MTKKKQSNKLGTGPDKHYRLTLSRLDFLLPQVAEFIKKKSWVNIQPEYQRRFVWDRYKKSLFVESLLLNIPIPSIFLLEYSPSQYEVMDGQQRLNAIIDFFKGEYKLKGLEKYGELNGKSYKDLDVRLRRNFDRIAISAIVIVAESVSTDRERQGIRRLVFERLNTGGAHLTAQEIRNCIYSGAFNKLLVELSQNELFERLFNIPLYKDNFKAGRVLPELAKNRLFKRMTDCEIILRYFAFKEKGNIKGSAKSILNDYMERHQNLADAKIDGMRVEFLNRLRLAHRVFGELTFKVPKKKTAGWKPSHSMFDATMIALDALYASKDDLIANKLVIRKGLSKLFQNENNHAVIVGRPNTSAAIRERQLIVINFLKKYI